MQKKRNRIPRLLALLLALAMLTALPACGSTQPAAATEETPEPTPEPTPSPADLSIEEGRKYYYCLDGTAYDSEKAADCFTQAAELGSGLAHWYLGNLCQRNLNKDRFQTAMEHYEKAIELGCDLGLLGKGSLYEYGQGVERDWDATRELYQQALDGGCAEANLRLGGLYENAHGVERDHQKALTYYTAALDSEELSYLRSAYGSIGDLYTQGVAGLEADYSQALSWYEKGVELGSTGAMVGLGTLYRDGTGVELDFEQAKSWYEKAAEAGSSGALVGLGFMAYSGLGSEVDYAAALDYYQQAAELGNANGLYWIGICYAYGRGVEQDGEKGIAYLEQAAEAGYTDAYRVIGQFYENGTGVKQDYAKAKEWYEKGVEAGSIIAMTNIGQLYQYGNGVSKNASTAIAWYQKAVDGGDYNAMLNLGNMYNWGGWNINLPRNYDKAADYFERAAELRPSDWEWFESGIKSKNVTCAYTLGYIYENGLGVEKDYEKALDCYAQAIRMAISVRDTSAQTAPEDAIVSRCCNHARGLAQAGFLTEEAVTRALAAAGVHE